MAAPQQDCSLPRLSLVGKKIVKKAEADKLSSEAMESSAAAYRLSCSSGLRNPLVASVPATASVGEVTRCRVTPALPVYGFQGVSVRCGNTNSLRIQRNTSGIAGAFLSLGTKGRGRRPCDFPGAFNSSAGVFQFQLSFRVLAVATP